MQILPTDGDVPIHVAQYNGRSMYGCQTMIMALVVLLIMYVYRILIPTIPTLCKMFAYYQVP